MASVNGARSLSYHTRQTSKDIAYRKEYRAWLSQLPPAERQNLKALHLDRPLIDYHISESICDITERNFRAPALVEPDLSSPRLDARETAIRILIRVGDAANPRLEVATLQFVFGVNLLMGLSGTQIAAKYGLSRAAFSKRCKECQREFGIPPSRAMKSLQACEVYRFTNGATKTRPNAVSN
jgi:hypothetical protein